MFDIGWTELLLIGIVALIVVGPKDLPGMFRTLGRFTGKMRGMAREFSRAMNEAADEAGVKDVTNTLKSATSPKNMGLDALNSAADKFEKWDPTKAAKPSKTKGPETQRLSEERAEARRKIHEQTTKMATERRAAEADAEKTAKSEKPAAPAQTPKPKPASDDSA